MSALEKWLLPIESDGAATSATSATSVDKPQKSALFQVASHLLPTATSDEAMHKVATGSSGVATSKSLKNMAGSNEVAEIAEIAGDKTTPTDDTERFEERAAIVQYDAGIPREWAEGFARLYVMPRHPDFTEEDWQTLIDDAGRFMDQWAVQVASMGWSVGEVFGVNYDKPDARIDLKGLVLCIGGHEVIAVSADTVTIQTASGARQRMFRRADEQSPGRVPVWEIGYD